MIKLRQYQQEAVATIIKSAKEGVLRQAIVMATGSGKTVCFASLVPLVRAKGKKTLILAHREELLEQAKDKLLKIDSTLKVEIEQAEKVSSLEADVVVASVPTLGRKGSKRIEKFNPDDYGLIIQDECHHSTSDSFKRVYEYFDILKGSIKKANSRVFLGFTATPSRADHIGLDTIFDKIVYTYSLRQGIDEGYLANIKAYTANTNTDISQVSTRMGDFVDKELEEVINTEERNRLVVETYQELTPNTKALVFAVDVQHTKDLCEEFQKAGILAKCVLGFTDKNERKNILKEFEEGKVKVLVNCGCFTEGFDSPSIETILMARPTKSSVLFSQMCGRGSRITDTKKEVNVIDFVDNTGNNKIMTLPSLFGCSATLKGTKGKKITEIMDLIDEIKEINPDFNVENIEDWNDEERIDKVIKEINIFEQAELPREVKQYSKYSWERFGEGFIIKIPPKQNNQSYHIELKPNMLDQYEVRIKQFDRVTPNKFNGWTGWQKKSENLESVAIGLEDSFKKGDDIIEAKFSEYKTMFNQDAGWRQDAPTEKQIKMLLKFKIPTPKGLTKGGASVLLAKAFSERGRYNH